MVQLQRLGGDANSRLRDWWVAPSSSSASSLPSVGACGVLMAGAPTVSARPSLAVTPASYMLFYRRCDGRPAHHQSGRPAVLSQPFLSRFSAAESVRRPTQAKHRPHRLPAAEAPPEIHAHCGDTWYCRV
eukprot:COSAG01_NODE_3878_length_5597_cov_2.765005_1_plen_130_part_00